MYAIKVINRKEPGRSTSHYSECFPQIGAVTKQQNGFTEVAIYSRGPPPGNSAAVGED